MFADPPFCLFTGCLWNCPAARSKMPPFRHRGRAPQRPHQNRAGPRVVLRSRHSALWAVAVASNDLQANRPPLLAVLCPCGALSESSFQKKPSPFEKPKGGADAGGSGGQSPQRGSIRRGSVATEDRGSGTLPAGKVCARRRRRQVGAPCFSRCWVFHRRRRYKLFLKLKTRARVTVLENWKNLFQNK